MKKIKPETRNVFPSSMDRLRLKRSKNSTFQKFDDSYLLTDLENNKTENIISGPSSKQDTLVGVYSQSSGHNIPPQSSIKIEHDWEVRSDEARCLRANP